MKNSILTRSRLSTCILAALSCSVIPSQAFANESEEIQMEEVVATASRLKGSAGAVLEERKQQAFVADLLGAEQISRTGDSDAASALKRVTGLTLVDGKFIYVRGLGERYSSTTLNGANVPSPDPTRKVVPLDMFPAGIIENLSVQKAYSPSMAGEFGGGAIDIRTKSIPDEFVLNVSGKLGYNTENSDDGLTISGAGKDLSESTRRNAINYGVINEQILSIKLNNPEEAQRIVDESALSFTNSNQVQEDSIDPDYGVGFSVANRFDIDNDQVFGFSFAVDYEDSWDNSEKRKVRYDTATDGINAIEDRSILSTENNIDTSGILNLGYEFNSNHRFETTSIYLNNERDKVERSSGESFDFDSYSDEYTLLFEERELVTHQIRGMHNFPEWWNIGVDWQFSDSKAERSAPDERGIVYLPRGGEQGGQLALADQSVTPALTRFFSNLEDEAETFQWNASLPIYTNDYEIELKVGGDHSDSWRESRAYFFQYLFKNGDYLTNPIDEVLTPEVLTSDDTRFQQLLRVDDYVAARKIDAGYGQFDVLYKGEYRISGGVRYEDWRQAIVPVGFEDNRKTPLDPTPVVEDVWLPALSFTYILDQENQVRLGYGKTIVRPDLKELSPVRYLDPLTDNPIFGNPSLEVTEIQNFDLRWENYADNGDNLSVALFYKDLDNPIENVQLPGADESNVTFINAKSGEVYGVEVEFLKDLSFMGDFMSQFFLSGNVTLSDSEITIPDTYYYYSLANQALLPITSDDNAYVTNKSRRMTGHSEYVINMQLGYDSVNGEHSASVVYNVFGERVMSAGIDNMPDLEEEPIHSLDLVYTYYPTFETKVNFKIKNILDESQEFTRMGQTAEEKTKGTEFSLGFSWDF
ncbi:TonB-dependent receptor [Catenovulum sp. SM1970]|uniref:TonB-dependent receptor domain-containing protein n=1 Tax=Marinifaba aquimaris TaxID=2741323 RepID=UPI001573EEB4|nr:TonB-dependent receptor [Marinifaba aquimaris]NTS77785.1 TonB-dependent receptor [Marinifaba aquimaris]